MLLENRIYCARPLRFVFCLVTFCLFSTIEFTLKETNSFGLKIGGFGGENFRSPYFRIHLFNQVDTSIINKMNVYT